MGSNEFSTFLHAVAAGIHVRRTRVELPRALLDRLWNALREYERCL
jgi:hypothetical protein